MSEENKITMSAAVLAAGFAMAFGGHDADHLHETHTAKRETVGHRKLRDERTKKRKQAKASKKKNRR